VFEMRGRDMWAGLQGRRSLRAKICGVRIISCDLAVSSLTPMLMSPPVNTHLAPCNARHVIALVFPPCRGSTEDQLHHGEHMCRRHRTIREAKYMRSRAEETRLAACPQLQWRGAAPNWMCLIARLLKWWPFSACGALLFDRENSR
jgi:hypothetical protein